MRSLFIKILLSSFLTVIFAGIAMAVPIAAMAIVMPRAGGLLRLAASFVPILAVGLFAAHASHHLATVRVTTGS